MVKWAIEFSEFIIQFTKKIAFKGQALVDFIVDSMGNNFVPNNITACNGHTQRSISALETLHQWILI